MLKENITLRALRQYHGYNKKYFPFKFMQIMFQCISPYFNLWMSSEIVTALYESRDKEEIYMLVGIALLVNLLVPIVTSIFSRNADTALKVLEDKEAAAFNRKTLSLDYDKLENPRIRTLRRKIRENACVSNFGVGLLRQVMEQLLQNIILLSLSSFFFVKMVMAMISSGIYLLVVILFAIMITFFVIAVIYYQTIGKKEADVEEKIKNFMLRENQLGRGYIPNGMDARIYKQQKIITKIQTKRNEDHLKCFIWARNITLLLSSIYMVLVKVPEICAYLIICFYCAVGAFPVGSVIKYVGYFTHMANASLDLFRNISLLKLNEPFLKTYLDYFDIKNDMYQGSLAVEKRSDKKFDIEFCDVSFRYAGTDHYALKNINLKLKVGERLAVVGMNGSGKTTFIKLLCRLYDPTEGEILMNDFNIRKYDYQQYLDIFSVVFQDYNLLALPLGNNVSGAAQWDTVKAEQLLEEVGLGDRYAQMPKKLETPLYKNFDEDGVNISGGEAQKIALARALYKDASFIILDEPTAALDPIAEAEIYSRFDEIVGDKTAIYISHRLSSCRFCDKIAVFDHGEIVQMGTHEELVSDEDGKYYELWHAQAQYYTA